jgi:ATP-dependent DNA helicase RecQ
VYTFIQETARATGFVKPLKDEQLLCLSKILQGKDILAVLPTGFGKSLIFQLAPQVIMRSRNIPAFKSVGLVITPLNSIMLNQIQALHSMGISACSLDYSCSKAQTFQWDSDESEDESDSYSDNKILTTAPISDILEGKYSLIYAHPEAPLSCAQGEKLVKQLKKSEMLVCIAVDEAHIILEW